MPASDVEKDPERRLWPAVYTEADLAATIKAAALCSAKEFYRTSIDDPTPCQGDVIELPREIPSFDETGTPAALPPVIDHWLVLANSCDLDRNIEDVPWAPIAPIVVFANTNPEETDAIRSYQVSKIFCVPPWEADDVLRAADLTRIVPIHRAALNAAKIKARLRFKSWVLLNACLVRMLCRSDGRHV